MDKEHILVIRHGALGDIILSTGPFAAIRRHHADAHIVLLTTAPYAELLRQSPYFDDVLVDERPKFWNLPALYRLTAMLRRYPFRRVYDLQTSQRSSAYHRFFPREVEWSGIAPGASHRHDTPHRTTSHTLDRQKEQLAIAGIDEVRAPDVSWMHADLTRLALEKPYVLIVPGGSAHRLEKRWPEAAYAQLCDFLIERKVTPVLIGGKAEAGLLMRLDEQVPGCRNLCGMTGIADLAALGREAVFAVGNDTGPMHVIAASGCPALVLFSAASDPALCAPRGEGVVTLQRSSLEELPVEEVTALLSARLRLDSEAKTLSTAES